MSEPTKPGEAMSSTLPDPDQLWPLCERVSFSLDNPDSDSPIRLSNLTLGKDYVSLSQEFDSGNPASIILRPGSVEECLIFSRWFAKAATHFIRIFDEWNYSDKSDL